MRRPFEKKIYDESDLKAKLAAIEHLSNYFPGYKFELNPDKFGLDILMTYHGTLMGFVECDVKQDWESWSYPHSCFYFHEKALYNYMLQTEDYPILFFITNKRVSRAAIIDSVDLFSRPTTTLMKDDQPQGEVFVVAPIDAIFLDLRKKNV